LGESFEIHEFRSRVAAIVESLDATTPVAAIELLDVSPSRESAFVESAGAVANAARNIPGCNVYSVHKDVTAPASTSLSYLIYQDWQSREAFRSYWESQALKRFQSLFDSYLVTGPDLRFYFGWRQEQKASSNSPDDLWSSAFRLSWALSLFGAQQMVGLLGPSDTSKGFQALSRAAEGELNEPFRAAFRAGNVLQRGLLDIARDGLNGEIFDPARWMRIFSNIMLPSAAGPHDSLPRPFTSTPPAASPPKPSPVQQSSGATRSPASGSWGPMPQAPKAPKDGPAAGPAPGPQQPPIGESDISPDYPFPPHYCEVFGSRMHYIEQGAGQVILLLHGNPSWSYCWRNIIPHLRGLGRCIAPDLIGYGKSDKPDIEYQWFDHVRYLDQFIRKMGLKDIILVLHDQGSALGFHYAMRHENNVQAIAFFESLVRPFTWDNFSTPQFREIFKQFRTGDTGGLGWKLIVDQNIFIEQLLPQATGRPLSAIEMDYYRKPFKDPPSRLPIWRFPRQTAIGGEPKDVWDAVTEYSARLEASTLPKLMLYANPGALLTQEHVEWCKENFPNLKSVDIGPGLHFIEESSPHRIGREIAAWIRELRSHGG
jgi:haloalkane dehalogenase